MVSLGGGCLCVYVECFPSLSFLGLHRPSSKVRTRVKALMTILSFKPLSTECVFVGKEVSTPSSLELLYAHLTSVSASPLLSGFGRLWHSRPQFPHLCTMVVEGDNVRKCLVQSIYYRTISPLQGLIEAGFSDALSLRNCISSQLQVPIENWLSTRSAPCREAPFLVGQDRGQPATRGSNPNIPTSPRKCFLTPDKHRLPRLLKNKTN